MNRKIVFAALMVIGLSSSVAAANETVKIEQPASVEGEVSVGSGVQVLDNLTVNYTAINGSTTTFDMAGSGKFQRIFADNSFRITPNNTKSVELFTDVGPKTSFGWYNGSVSVSGAGVSDNLSVSVRLVDRIAPEISKVVVGDLMATTNSTVSLTASDNLNINTVKAEVFYSEVVNETTGERRNRSVQNMTLSLESGSTYTGVFTESGNIGRHWIVFTVSDESGNTETAVRRFQVNGLDSIKVLRTNFVFDTIRVKESDSEKFLRSELAGRTVKFKLESLSYGGNETVQIGVLGPGSESAVLFDKVGDTIKMDAKGVYELVLIHKGSDEVKGVHRVDGEVKVVKPDRHVKPRKVSVSFTGSVKNVDKPPAKCTRISAFTGCIGYDFESVKNMFEESYGEIGDGNKSFVWKISRLPITQVEGTDEWSQSTGFTMGEYQDAIRKNEKLKNSINNLFTWENTLPIGYKWQRNILVMLFLITFGLGRLDKENSMVVFKGVPENKFKEHYTIEEYQEEVDESYAG